MLSPLATKNWIGLICDSLVSSGQLSTWEATDYLTKNLFGDRPNPHFLNSPTPIEEMSFFLKGLYHPIVGAAFRDTGFPDDATFQVFIDATALGNAAVIIVSFSTNGSPQLLSVSSIQAWNLRFSDVFVFHEWAQARYEEVYASCLALHRKRNATEDRNEVQRGAKQWEHSHGPIHTPTQPSSHLKRIPHESGRSGS